MTDINIENIVASTQIADELNLDALSVSIAESKYNPKEFPGLIVHLQQPKTAVLLFSTGKLICTGAKNTKEVDDALHKVCAKIKGSGGTLWKNYDVTIQNTVASADIEKKLDLPKTAQLLGLDCIEYEPEQFPGLIYRMDEPHAVLLLFGSGKIVCTGAHTDDIKTAVTTMTDKLMSLGLI